MSLVSNVDASPIGTATPSATRWCARSSSPVRWVESVQKMIAMGVRRFVEIGPGNVLTGLIKRIDSIGRSLQCQGRVLSRFRRSRHNSCDEVRSPAKEFS